MTDILNRLEELVEERLGSEILKAAVENIMAGTLPPNQAIALETMQNDGAVNREWNRLLTAIRDLLVYEREILPTSNRSPDPTYCKKILLAVQCNADLHKAMDAALDTIEIKDERLEDCSIAAAAFIALNLKEFEDGGTILRRIRMIMLFKPTGKSTFFLPVSCFLDRMRRKFAKWLGRLFS